METNDSNQINNENNQNETNDEKKEENINSNDIDNNDNLIIEKQSKDLVNEVLDFFDNEENDEENNDNNNLEENNKNENEKEKEDDNGAPSQENKIEDKKEEQNKINNEEKKPEASNQNNIKEEKEKEKIKTPEKIGHNKSKKKVVSSKKVNKPKNIKPQTAKKKNNNSIDDKVYSRNHYRNENIKNYIKYKESKEIGECSFKPKINKRKGNAENNGIEKEKKENEDVVDRLMHWKDRVEKKKNDTKNKKDESATDGCTFNPKLNTEVPKFEDTKINGTKKYLERIKNSREIQKQKEEKLNPNYNDLYNKYYKKKEKTILDKNKKLTKKEYQNYLNVFHNALMNDDE